MSRCMRKIVLSLVIIVSMFLLTGCSKRKENKFVNVESQEDKIVKIFQIKLLL